MVFLKKTCPSVVGFGEAEESPKWRTLSKNGCLRASSQLILLFGLNISRREMRSNASEVAAGKDYVRSFFGFLEKVER